jgi:hypothetical protein
VGLFGHKMAQPCPKRHAECQSVTCPC